MSKIRTRFAPSPTGFLHLGGVRTALYNFLYSRRFQGQFLLRIEDTDKQRSTDEAVRVIIDGLAWVGIQHDEEIVFQSQRLAEHQAAAQELLDKGAAYKCFCTQEEVEARKAETGGRSYDRHCRDRTDEPDKPFAIRFKMPLDGETVIPDLIQGEVHKPNEEYVDPIILRSDGLPVYHLAVVVDDAFMDVTHVLRGKDHLNNTVLHIQLIQALGYDMPQYGHMPLLLNVGGSKLSKRDDAANFLAYRDRGVLPEAMINFIARFGWGHENEEILSMERLLEVFDIADVGKGEVKLDEGKLHWLGQEWLKRLSADEVVRRMRTFRGSDDRLKDFTPELQALIEALVPRAHTLAEMLDGAAFYLDDEIETEEKMAKKHLVEKNREIFTALRDALSALDEPWQGEATVDTLRKLAEDRELGFGKVAMPLRVALTGRKASPPIDVVCNVLGKQRVVARLEDALTRLSD